MSVSVTEDEEEVDIAVRHLHHNRDRGLSIMRADHLRAWLRVANWEELPDPSQWDMAVGLIQDAFCKGHLVEECTWRTIVLIPKGTGNFCGIRLVKVLWKTVTGILNRRLTTEIQFRDTLHGFCTSRGTGTASLEANLPQHIMAMR